MSDEVPVKDKGGRPKGTFKVAITEIDYERIENMAAIGLTLPQIGAIMGMSKSALLRRAAEDTKLSESLERGRANGIATVVQTAYKMATDGKNPAMTQFFLKCRSGWAEKNQLEISGRDGGPIEVENVTLEEVRERKAELLKLIKSS